MDLERIVEAALRLLGERGLPDLSMRAVAASLGVQPSALYWHVRSKQELLGLVADSILATATVGEPGSLANQAERLRQALLAHRDGAELVASSIALGMGGAALRDSLRAAARELPEARAALVVEAIALVLLGSTQLEQQRAQARAIGIEMGDGEATPAMADLVQLIIDGAA